MNHISSLYIHFPFCQHLCNYCDFFKHKLEGRAQVQSFEELLLMQWSTHKELLLKEEQTLGELKTLYIGGGTPSLWKTDGPKFLKSFFKNEAIKLAPGCEFTIEVDPGTWTRTEIEAWMEIGVNRFSIGSQAFSDEFLKVMDRKHSLSEVKETLLFFKDLGVNFSVDLMIGLPFAESRNLKAELESLLSFEPGHLSVYILKARKSYPHIQSLPEDDLVADEYLFVSDFLKSHGYHHYEVSNFAKQGLESKHNIQYWEYESVIGLGPNATGLIVKDDYSLRYQWKSSRAQFRPEKVEGSSLLLEKLYMGIRHSGGLKWEEYFKDENLHSARKLYPKWLNLGYLDLGATQDHIILSSKGYLMCDSLIDDVFANTNT